LWPGRKLTPPYFPGGIFSGRGKIYPRGNTPKNSPKKARISERRKYPHMPIKKPDNKSAPQREKNHSYPKNRELLACSERTSKTRAWVKYRAFLYSRRKPLSEEKNTPPSRREVRLLKYTRQHLLKPGGQNNHIRGRG